MIYDNINIDLKKNTFMKVSLTSNDLDKRSDLIQHNAYIASDIQRGNLIVKNTRAKVDPYLV